VFSLLVLAQPSAPAAGVAYAFNVALCTIGWLVPLGVFRRPFGLVLVRKAWWKWRKNLSRLAADSSLKPERGNSREKWPAAIIRANDPAHGYEGGTNLATSPSA
jgi:hypothetical protein